MQNFFLKVQLALLSLVIQGGGESELAHPDLEISDINMSQEELNKLRQDLDFMMTRYEGELKRPIRNVVTGKLPRTLLIQVRPSNAQRTLCWQVLTCSICNGATSSPTYGILCRLFYSHFDHE